MLRVLSIDDSKAVHSYLTDCLSGKQVQLEHAYGGKQGLEMASKDTSFDLILLDWEMPDMVGPDVLKALRDNGNKTPVIMLTSKNDIKEIAKALDLGANEYVMKPFSAEIILEKIEVTLGTKVN